MPVSLDMHHITALLLQRQVFWDVCKLVRWISKCMFIFWRQAQGTEGIDTGISFFNSGDPTLAKRRHWNTSWDHRDEKNGYKR